MTPNARVGAEDEYVRLPGLYRRWDLDRVIEPGSDFRVENAGSTSEGTLLFAVYRREVPSPAPAETLTPAVQAGGRAA